MEPIAVVVVLGVVLALLLTVVLLGWSRRRTLTSRVGSFLCQLDEGVVGDAVAQTLAAPEAVPSGVSGVAQYGTGRLVWWRAVSLVPRPARTWDRGALAVIGRTDLGIPDPHGRLLVRIRCRHRAEVFDLTVTEGAAAGLVSWLESAPRSVGRVM